MPQKNKTLDQVTAMQEKAVRFLRDVKGDEDAAAEFEAMSPEEYAEHKRVKLVENPRSGGAQITIRRITIMAKPTRAELEAQVEDQQAEIDALNDKLDLIAGITNDEDIDVDEDEDEDDIDDDREDEDLD